MSARFRSVDELPAQHRKAALEQIDARVRSFVDGPSGAPVLDVTNVDAPSVKRIRKFLNQPVEIDGHALDSGKEGERYKTLRNMRDAGLIRDLRVHPLYPLHAAGGELVGEYEADFDYVDHQGNLVVEDVKSERTVEAGLYNWKRRHMAAEYGIHIREHIHRWKRKAKRHEAVPST